MSTDNYFIKKIKSIIRIIMAAIVMSIVIIAAGGIYADAEPVDNTVDLYGTYNAALGLRTDKNTTNIYRMGYYHKESAGTKRWKHLSTGTYPSENYRQLEGKFKDVKIKGNGKYTVSLENADFMGETDFSKMQVSTDIPDTGQIKFSNMVVKINGEEVGNFKKPYVDNNKEAKGNCCLLVINKERTDFEGIDSNCVPQGTENKITISFKVSGFSYKKGETPATPEPVQTKEPEVTKKPEDTKEPAVATQMPAVSAEPVTGVMVPEEIRPFVIISIIIISVIAIIAITFNVTRRKK